MCERGYGANRGLVPGSGLSDRPLLPIPEHHGPSQAHGRQMDVVSALPEEISLRVLSMLPPRDIASVGCVSRQLRALERRLARSNEVVFLTPSPAPSVIGAPKDSNPHLDTASWPRLVKTERPGLGTFMGAEPVNVYNTLFEMTIERMDGAGMDIGVAPVSALAGGHIQKDKAWLFDCWGRASYRGVSYAYGAKTEKGDRVGVLYNAATDTLSFLLNGVSMGPAFSGLKANLKPGQMLYPIINMPFIPGEAVRLSSLCPAGLQADLFSVEHSSKQWVPPPHPDDGNLVVETLWAGKPYRLPIDKDKEDLMALTFGTIKDRLAALMKVDTTHLSILVGGSWQGDAATLQSCKMQESAAFRGSSHQRLQRIIVHTFIGMR